MMKKEDVYVLGVYGVGLFLGWTIGKLDSKKKYYEGKHDAYCEMIDTMNEIQNSFNEELTEKEEA